MDEKTKQIKDDGLFPEYKRMCRKLNVIPNHYLLRHSTDDDIRLRHRYLSKNDCIAMGYEMKARFLKPKTFFSNVKEKNTMIARVNLSENYAVNSLDDLVKTISHTGQLDLL